MKRLSVNTRWNKNLLRAGGSYSVLCEASDYHDALFLRRIINFIGKSGDRSDDHYADNDFYNHTCASPFLLFWERINKSVLNKRTCTFLFPILVVYVADHPGVCIGFFLLPVKHCCRCRRTGSGISPGYRIQDVRHPAESPAAAEDTVLQDQPCRSCTQTFFRRYVVVQPVYDPVD